MYKLGPMLFFDKTKQSQSHKNKKIYKRNNIFFFEMWNVKNVKYKS